MTIAIERLHGVTRDFGRRHIAYQMARELLEIYKNKSLHVWNELADFPPEKNDLYLVLTDYGAKFTAFFDCETEVWEADGGRVPSVTHWMDLPANPKQQQDVKK